MEVAVQNPELAPAGPFETARLPAVPFYEGGWKEVRSELAAKIIASVWADVITRRDELSRSLGLDSPYALIPDDFIRTYMHEGDFHPLHTLRLIGKTLQDFAGESVERVIRDLPAHTISWYEELLERFTHPSPPREPKATPMIRSGVHTALTTMTGLMAMLPFCFEKMDPPCRPTCAEMQKACSSALDMAERMAGLHVRQLVRLFSLIGNSGDGTAAPIVMNIDEPFSADYFYLSRTGDEIKLKLNQSVSSALAIELDSPRAGCPAGFLDVEIAGSSTGKTAIGDLRSWVERLGEIYCRRAAEWSGRW